MSLLLSRPARPVAALATLGLAGGLLVAAAPSASAVPAGPWEWTTPGTYTWTVPDGVTVVRMRTVGAAGGQGGAGGSATALFQVTPGDDYQVNVGGEGLGYNTDPLVEPLGGYNGGGDGGAIGVNGTGRSGGGASDIRFGGTALTDRILVAGGGGGGYFGGDGGEVGEDGGGAAPGLGATASAGGAGGGGGTSGALGVGGDGVYDGNCRYTGSGGGGGYYGGGGSGCEWNSSGYGGGGGSSYGPAETVFETGVGTGDGSVTISVPAPSISSVSPTTGPLAGGDTVTIYGSDLDVVTDVAFDGVSAEDLTVVSPTELTVTLPAAQLADVIGTLGVVDVEVSGLGFTDTAVGGFTYELPSDPPTVPLSVVARPGNGSVTVSWSPPADEGSSEVLGYDVFASPGDAECWTEGELSCTVTGLTNGTRYTFTVIAWSDSGDSEPSAPSAGVVPRARPTYTMPVKGTYLTRSRVLTSTGTPAAYLRSATPSTCRVAGPEVVLLRVTGTCTVSVVQLGTVIATRSTSVVAGPPVVGTPLAGSSIPIASGSVGLSSASRAALDAMLPALRAAKVVVVTGWASGNTTTPSDLAMSAARAGAVRAYLKDHGVSVSAVYGAGAHWLGTSDASRAAQVSYR